MRNRPLGRIHSLCAHWHAGRIGKAFGQTAARGTSRFETLQAYYYIERELVPVIDEEQPGFSSGRGWPAGYCPESSIPAARPMQKRAVVISNSRR